MAPAAPALFCAALLAVAALLSALPVPAGAVVVSTGGGRHAGIAPRAIPNTAAVAIRAGRGTAGPTATAARAATAAQSPPIAALGPGAFPPGYQSLIEQYFTDVAAASGQASNDYSVAAQYGDVLDEPLTDVDDLGRTYKIAFQSSTDANDDGEPYPADRDPTASGPGHRNPDGCAPDPADKYGDSAYAWCLTDAQLQSEISRVIALQHWPAASMGAIYFVFLAPAIDVCTGPTGGQCAGHPNPASGFCAYHSSFGDGVPAAPLYAVLPYGDVYGCRTGEAPNGAPGTSDDPGDDETSMISHEQNESIDDPLGDAWLDSDGDESADLCAGTGSSGAVYGTPLGGGAGQLYNQVINGHPYFLQDEFADLDPNAAGAFDACEQRPGAPADAPANSADALVYHGGPVVEASTAYAIFWSPTAVATPPTPALSVSATVTHVGQPVTFDASGSQGANLVYHWSFGDGQTATGAVVTHAWGSSGSFKVKLVVQDTQTQYAQPVHQTEVVLGPRGSLSVTGLGRLRLLSSAANVVLRSGKTVFCPHGGSPCHITAVVSATPAGASGGGAQPRGVVDLGSSTVTVGAGHHRQIRVTIDARGVALLRSGHAVSATVRITARAGHAKATSITVTSTISLPATH